MSENAGKRVEFTRDVHYKNTDPSTGPWFRQGEQYDFTNDFADRWFKRDAVTEVKFTGKTTYVGREGPFVPVGARASARPKTPGATAAKANAGEVINVGVVLFDAPDLVPVFAEGDVVRLKSGGPEMLVEAVADDGKVTASWQNDDQTEGKGEFTPETLEKVEAEAPARDTPNTGLRAPPKPGDAG